MNILKKVTIHKNNKEFKIRINKHKLIVLSIQRPIIKKKNRIGMSMLTTEGDMMDVTENLHVILHQEMCFENWVMMLYKVCKSYHTQRKPANFTVVIE